MIELTEAERRTLEPLLSELDGLLASEDENDFLLALDGLITQNLDTGQNWLSEKGLELQAIYDAIYGRLED